MVFDWIAGSSQVITLWEEGVRAKAKFQRKVISGELLISLPTYSLDDRLLENPLYCVCNFYTLQLLVALVGCSLLKFTRKK